LNAYQQKWHIEVGLQSSTASLSSDCQTEGNGGELAISSPLGMHNLASGLEGLDGPTLRKNNYKQEALMMSQIVIWLRFMRRRKLMPLAPPCIYPGEILMGESPGIFCAPLQQLRRLR
jgi:hypothetical protein